MKGRSSEALFSKAARPLLWAILAFVSVIPTISFLALAFSPRLFDQGASWLSTSSFSLALQGTELTGLRNSVLIGIGASSIATVIAAVLALSAQRTDLWFAKWIPTALWGVLLVPTYVIAVGWDEILASGNLFSQIGLVTPGIRNLFLGPLGIVLILGFSGVPFAYFAMAPAISGMGRRFEEAARIHGARWTKTIRTVTPIIFPALFAALIIVFAEALGDFGVASTIAANANIPVATTNIMAAIATFPTNFGEAAAVSWFLVLILGAVLTLQNRLTRSRNFAVLSGRSSFAAKIHLTGAKRLSLLGFIYTFFALTLLVPFLGAVISTLLKPYTPFKWSNLTLSAFTTLFSTQSLGGPILVSLKMATINATLTVIIGFAIARVITSPRPGVTGRFTDIILIGSVALPALVLAAGFIFVFNLPLTMRLGINIFGTMILLGIGYLAIALPSNSRLLIGPVAQLDGSLMHAGRIHGAGQTKSFRRCVLPLLSRSIIWAWLLTFSSTFGELPTSQMLAPTGVRTVATAILASFQTTNLASATALSLVQMSIVLGVIGVVQGGFRLFAPVGWRNVGVGRRG